MDLAEPASQAGKSGTEAPSPLRAVLDGWNDADGFPIQELGLDVASATGADGKEAETEPVLTPPVPKVGERCKVKDLFASKKTICECCIDWANEPPSNDDDAPELVFRPPFTPLVHRWQQLLEAERAAAARPSAEEHIQLFRETLKHELDEAFRALNSFEKTQYLKFDDLALAYEPGDTLMTTVDGVMSAGRLRSARFRTFEDNTRCFCCTVGTLDYDGKSFGGHMKVFHVPEYEGMKQVPTLATFPLRLHPGRDKIQQRLVERGRVFESLHGQHFRFHDGNAFALEDRESFSRQMRPGCIASYRVPSTWQTSKTICL